MKTFNHILAVLSIGAWTVEALATSVTLNFSGVNLTVHGEYINANPVATENWQFASLFQSGQTVTGSIAYDTNQADINSSSSTGTYRIGSLSINIPQIGFSAQRSSNIMQISVFNESPYFDEFFSYVEGVDNFSSNVGLPDPVSMSFNLYGLTTMFSNDSLPTSLPNWVTGDMNIDFRATDGTIRQVFMVFEAAPVPEPATMLLFGTGIAGLAVVGRRKRS